MISTSTDTTDDGELIHSAGDLVKHLCYSDNAEVDAARALDMDFIQD
jgi:hypothetical protein